MQRCALLGTVALSFNSVAIDFNYGGRATTEFATNPALQNNGDEDLSVNLTGEITATNQSARYILDATYQVSTGYFANDTVDDFFNTSGAARLNVNLLPQRLNWRVANSRSVVPVNQLEGVSRDNEQVANSFTTGPELLLRLSARDDIKINYAYNSTTTSESNIDLDKDILTLDWEHRSNSFSEYVLMLRNESADYNNDGLNESRQDFIGSAKFDLSSTLLHLHTGVSYVSDGSFIDDLVQPYISLKLNKRINTSTDLTVNLSNILTDTAEELSQFQFSDFTNVGDFDNPNLIRRQSAEVSFTKTFPRLVRAQITLDSSALDYRFDRAQNGLTAEDQTSNGVSLEFRVPVYSNTTVSSLAAFRATEFDQSNITNNDSALSLLLEQALTKHWSFSVGANLAHRDSEQDEFDYDNAALNIGLSWFN